MALFQKVFRFSITPPRSSPLITRIRSDDFPVLSLSTEVICGWLIVGYSAVFMGAWNSYFPSPTEKLLWRISSVITLCFTAIVGWFYFYVDHVVLRETWKKHEKGSRSKRSFLQVRGRSAQRRSASPLPQYRGDPFSASVATGNTHAENTAKKMKAVQKRTSVKGGRKQMPLVWFIPCTFLAACYCFARIYVLSEDLIGLRNLPVSAFDTVPWTLYLPGNS